MRVRFDPVKIPVAEQPRAHQGSKEVPPRNTVLSRSEIRRALDGAHQSLRGEPMSEKLLDVLTAQVSHETGHGASMYNFNFGGIKGTSPEGTTAKLRTREVFDGREVSIKDGFRAYSSAAAGATDYILLLERRFPNAIEAAKGGDVDGFVRGLKAGRYFTADEGLYAKAVRGIVAQGVGDDDGPAPPRFSRSELRTEGSSLSWAAAGGGTTSLDNYPTSAAVARVLDAVAALSVDIADPEKHEA